MRCRLRQAARWLLIAAVLLGTASLSEPAPTAGAGENPSARIEVRLRKLHLVRPDLIPYPIAYEVCC